MDWDLLMAFAMGTLFGSCLTLGVSYIVVDIFFTIEDDDEGTEVNKN
jgi:hypothetical protein